jgi:hypothetical protein
MKRATVFDYSLLALIRDSGGITLNGVHEASHAVVGAYWRLPIRSVRLEHSAFSTRYRKGFGGHVTLSSTLFSKSTVDTMLRRGEYRSRVASKLNDCAAMALGARAAVELIIPPHLQDEGS